MMVLADQAFDFYFDMFTHVDGLTEDAKEYGKVKKAMIGRFSPKKPQAILMKEAVSLRYQGGDLKRFIEENDRCYRKANFND